MTSYPPRSLQIIDEIFYQGPNRYGYRQGLVIIVDLGDLEKEPSNVIIGFNDHLLQLIPTLHEHTCSYGETGGFVKRLTEDKGTWLGHVFEHVAIEIQSLAGMDITYGKTRQIQGKIGRTGIESVYRVYIEIKNEETSKAASKLSMRLINHILDNDFYADFNYKDELIEVIKISEKYAYGPTTGSIVEEATRRGIPSISLKKSSSLVQLGWGKNQKRIWASTTSNSSFISTEIAQDKELTLQLLYNVGIPVPMGGIARSLDQAMQIVSNIDYPLVTKPLDMSHGRGVSINIRNKEDLERGFNYAQNYTNDVIIERFIEGNDYRVLIINGEFKAAAMRIPAHVIGDGLLTLQELINLQNQDPRRGIGHEKMLTKIYIDESTEKLIEDQKLTLQDIPDLGRFVQLKSTANLSTGGTSKDVTDIIHFENIQLAERAIKTIGLDIAGVDIIAKDISIPIANKGGVIIEVNAAPGFRMHLEPTDGRPRNVAKPVIDMLFPKNSTGRIPIVAITGTNGKTTVARWITHILKLTGKNVGLTTTDGIYIDGILEYSGDCTGPWSAKVVLSDPTVDIAVLETARGGILRQGLGWDYCDVAVVLNISDDHLGLRGVETLDEMAEIKGVILDQVKDNGHGILNADDKRVMAQKSRISGNVVLVSLDYQNPILTKHVDGGNTAITLTPNGMIQLIQDQSQTPIIHITDIPAAFGGHAIFNVQNALFTIAAVIPYVSIANIRLGLSTFTMNYKITPGRLNIEYLKGARVIMDYGHNPKALDAQCQLVNGFYSDQGNQGRRALVFGLPGDRPDSTIIKSAKIVAGKYDRYFIKEDWNLRGRNPGEVALILMKSLLENGVDENQIMTFYDKQTELDAVASMYDWLELNDIVLLQTDDNEKVREFLLVNLAKVTDSIIKLIATKKGEESKTYTFRKYLDDPVLDEPAD
ncbi:MAG: cyanophycin synthetase [Candidatus Heimdallarchaeota archaeon]|nr:cyanophycin synthetase [Candidatus Heimdallarchaeota archaeon]MDH5646846.1 cyanophycin synthetase [Candidatus Heimdallarchaeota archaeon]